MAGMIHPKRSHYGLPTAMTIFGVVLFLTIGAAGIFAHQRAPGNSEASQNYAQKRSGPDALIEQCNPALIVVNDNAPASPYPATIEITEGGSITEVRVHINSMTHSYPDDFDVLLVGPDGRTVLLMSDVGGGLDISDVDLTFDDDGTAMPNSSQLVSTTYRPTNYIGNDVTDAFVSPAPPPPYGADLSSFIGTDAAGIWSLYVEDDEGQDVGLIAEGWCLEITTSSVTPTSTATDTPVPTDTPTDTVEPSPTDTPTDTVEPTVTGTITTEPSTTATIPEPSNTSTSTATNTVPPSATPVPCFDSGTIQGALTVSDPLQVGRLSRNGTVSTCIAPKTCPSVFDTESRHFDSYTFTNNAPTKVCYTVRINAQTCVEARYLFSAVYLSSYDPQNLCTNYLADIGANPNPTGEYSFVVPALSTFVVVVHELDLGAGCPGYTLNVSSCPPPPPCQVRFADVAQGSTFYSYVRCLACADILNGYPCGGLGGPCNGNSDPYFRPSRQITRGQLAKVVSNAAGFSGSVGDQTFEDVMPGSTFYEFVEQLANRNIIDGYPCGGPNEPCGSTNRPYFRPNANVSRGQASKITSEAKALPNPPTGQRTFQEDLPEGSTFWTWVEALASVGAIGGYPCGGPGEPCIGPSNWPYFRPGSSITRGQASKVISSAFFPGCSTGTDLK